MAVIPGLKESVFGVSYAVYEPSTHNPVGPWRVRWYVVGYLIDAVQVTDMYTFADLGCVENFFSLTVRFNVTGFEDLDQHKVQ